MRVSASPSCGLPVEALPNRDVRHGYGRAPCQHISRVTATTASTSACRPIEGSTSAGSRNAGGSWSCASCNGVPTKTARFAIDGKSGFRTMPCMKNRCRCPPGTRDRKPGRTGGFPQATAPQGRDRRGSGRLENAWLRVRGNTLQGKSGTHCALFEARFAHG